MSKCINAIEEKHQAIIAARMRAFNRCRFFTFGQIPPTSCTHDSMNTSDSLSEMGLVARFWGKPDTTQATSNAASRNPAHS